MFMAVLLLVLMGALGLAAIDMAGRDRQSAGFQNRTRSAFYAAEAGAAHGRDLVGDIADHYATPPPLPTTTLGDLGAGNLYDREGQLPQYYGDPDFADPIRWSNQIGPPAPGANLQGGAPRREVYFFINVVGQSPGALGSGIEGRASTARIEAVQTRVLSVAY